MPEWAQITVSILTGIVGIAYSAIRLWPRVRRVLRSLRRSEDKKDKQQQARFQFDESLRAMRQARAIRMLMMQWLHRKGAQRILWLTANNGGESWKTGQLYINCVDQVVGPFEENTTEQYRDRKADGPYRRLLGELLDCYTAEQAKPIVADKLEDGLLRDIYKSQGTVCSLVLPFAWENGAVLHYLSINFGRNPQPIGQSERRDLTDAEKRKYIEHCEDIARDRGRVRGLIADAFQTYDRA